MPRVALFALAALAGLAPIATVAPATACDERVFARFQESSPDFVVIGNRAPPGWRLVSAEWRLAGSTGDVVFDTAFGGLGVSMPQAFSPNASEVRLTSATEVADGGDSLTLGFEGFDSGLDFAFAIDLDDRLGRNEAVVSGSEIAGAEIAFTMAGPGGLTQTVSARFDASSTATALFGCGV